MDPYHYWLFWVLSTGLFIGEFGGANPVVTQPPGLLRRYTGETASLSWLFNQTFNNGGTRFTYNGLIIYKVDQKGNELIHPAYTGRLIFSRTNVSVTLDLLAVNISDAAHGNYTLTQFVIGDDYISNREAEIFIYATPTISLTRLPSGDIIENQTVTFTCLVQPQSVPSHHRLPIEYIWRRNGLNISLPLDRHSVHDISGGQELRVDPVHRSDISYQCVAQEQTSVLEANSSLISVDVYYTPGPASTSTPTVNRFEGTMATLVCSVTDRGNPTLNEYRWHRGTDDKGTTVTGNKTIPMLNVTDHDGMWTCAAVNTIGEGTPADINVTVYAHPTILNPPSGPVIPLAEDVNSLDILCSIRGRPAPSVTWTYQGSGLPPGVESVSEADTSEGKLTTVNRRLRWKAGSTLEQRRLTGGQYSCTGSVYTETTNMELNVDVQYGPYNTAIIPPQDQVKVENESPTLNCTARCNPACGYSWLRDTHNISTQGVLHFSNIKRTDHGQYSCHISNNRGQDQQETSYVSVHYPPELHIERVPSGEVVKGNNVTVICAIDSRPTENTITWTNLTGGPPPDIIGQNDTLSWISLINIDILDTGELQCRADNGVPGSPSSTRILLDVLGPVRVNHTEPKDNQSGAGIGESASFTVSIIANPIPPESDWSWGFVHEYSSLGVKLSMPAGVNLTIIKDVATLNITNVTTEHFGNYSLLTSNKYGGWDIGDVAFVIFASGPPSRPTGFQAVRVTAVSVTVEWVTGFDGGLPQTFTITYTNVDSGDEGEMSDIPDECSPEGCTMQRKITEGIADDAEYELQISADNGKFTPAIGDTITVYTPIRASLPQPAKISLGDTDAEITFSVIGQLTDVTIHHCAKDTEICEDDKFPILTPQQNNQGRGRRQARYTMSNFSQNVDLVDPSASSFAFQFMLHDGDDIIHSTTSIVIDRKGTNIGAIIGGVIGGLVLAALVVVLVLWRRGIIFQREKGDNKQISQEGEYVNAVGPQALSTIYNDIPADVSEPNTYEGLMETNISKETSTYAGLAQTTVKTFNTSNMNVLGVINDGAFYRVSVVSITSTHQGKLPNRLVMKATKEALMYPVHSEYLEGAAKAMVKLVNCDNIMRCLGVDSSMTGLLLQHVPHGTLRQYLTGLCDNTYINSTSNQNRDLIHFIHQAANGAAAVAELKPETLFYCLSLDHVLLGKNLNVKLTGFSLAESVKAREFVEAEDKISRPLRWLSPEAIDLQHTTQSDVWGFAVLIWEILSQGRIPFDGIADADIRSHIGAGHRLTKPPPCTDDMFDMMSECWKLKARNRPTMVAVKSLLHEMTVYQNV